MSRLAAAWNRFFFQPERPSAIGVFRIVYGLVLFNSLVGKYLDRRFLYGIDGLITPPTVAGFFEDHERFFNFFYLVPLEEPGLTLFFIMLMIAAVFLILGVGTRLSNLVLFIGLLALANRNPMANNAGDELIRIDCFFLLFSQADKAFALESWWRRDFQNGRPLFPPWAQRLLQLQFVYVYLDTVWLKLHGSAWLNGTALYYALNYLELRRFDFRQFFHYLWQIRLATWSVLVIESSMFSLVWWRKARPFCLLACLSLHLGILMAMQLFDFQLIMIANLALFVDSEWMDRIVGQSQNRSKARAEF